MNSQLKNIIFEKALELGFADLKIAKAEPLSLEIKKYREWVEAGYNATMQWMDKNYDKRENVSLIVENAKSVITLAFPYNTGFNYPKLENSGKIARYAWGTDYHDFLPQRLELIISEILNLVPNSKSKAYVDTGPILERQWAEKSGLGWQGKNSLIMNKKLGSYFFLAIIITDVEFEYDQPISDRCGKCTKCIDACPTKAIIAPKIVDANKCISYWTIEAKPDNEIPDTIAKNQKDWLYGCDICQEVCPWNNHRVKLSIEPLLFPRLNQTNLEFEYLENISKEDFSIRFKNSPIKRTKLKGLQRNVKALKNKEI